MNSGIHLLLAFLGGGALAGVFLAGLWYTVQRLAVADHPAVLTLASLLIRLTVVVLGFYVLSAGQWQPLLASLAGFIALRTVVVRRIRMTLAPAVGAAQRAEPSDP